MVVSPVSHGAPDASALLSVRGLDGGHGPIQVLTDISFDVREGELMAIIGANGAGKTTLLRILSGLIQPMRGSIRFAGRRDRRQQQRRDRRPRALPRAGRSSPFLRPHRRGESPPRELPTARQVPARGRRCACSGVRVFPSACRAARAARGHHVGRRAADVRHRTRFDGGAATFSPSTSSRLASRRSSSRSLSP